MTRLELMRCLEIVAARPMLHRKDLVRRYGKTERTISRWMAEGYLPEPTYLKGSSAPMWAPMDLADFEARTRRRPR